MVIFGAHGKLKVDWFNLMTQHSIEIEIILYFLGFLFFVKLFF